MMKSWMYLLFFCALQGSDGQLRREPEPQVKLRECPKPQLKYTCNDYVCYDNAPKPFRCLQYGDSGSSGVYVISTCNSNWKGSIEIKRKCEGPTDISDPISAAPVTSQSRGITYRNLYCAECNQAEMESLESFLHNPLCRPIKGFPEEEIVNHLTYDQTNNAWNIKRSDAQGNPTIYECQIKFAVPGYLSNSVRSCDPNLVSECDPNWKNETVRQLCGEYTSIVYKQCTRYKNPHCAICNQIRAETLQCMDSCPRREPFHFGYLIDINRREECSPFHLYDPYKKKCRKLTCALSGYVIRGNTCVKAD